MRHTFSFSVLFLACLVTGFADGQERDQPRGQERDQPREGERMDREIRFQPQNERERALWMMIQQLRSEVSQLRQELGNRDRPTGLRDNPSRNSSERMRREGDAPRESARERDGAPLSRSSNDPLMRQATRIFAAYDKNRDQRVSFDEWLAMREGEMTSERRAREMGFFSQQAGDDRIITIEEFYLAMVARQRGSNARESGPRDAGPRESGPRDAGPRESGPRDAGPREGSTRVRDGG